VVALPVDLIPFTKSEVPDQFKWGLSYSSDSETAIRRSCPNSLLRPQFESGNLTLILSADTETIPSPQQPVAKRSLGARMISLRCSVVCLFIFLSQSAYSQHVIETREFVKTKRPFNIQDSIRMTTFGDPKYEDGRNPEDRVAQFSPDRTLFAIILKKGNIEQDTNDYSLLLYHTEAVFDHPTPNVILSLSSSSNRPAIEQLTWLDNETLAFLGERPGERHQLYTLNCKHRRPFQDLRTFGFSLLMKVSQI
jgi:hypothetical protein